MKKKTFIAVLIVWCIIFSCNIIGQNHCQSNRYSESQFFNDEEITNENNLVYGIATDWEGISDTQRFHIFYPKTNIDPLTQRPFIMLMHGGGFAPETDFSNKNQWNKLCLLLAKRGFVVATIDYRVGWTDRHKTWAEYTTEERKNPTGIYAIYRAYQDARAALRYFVHYSYKFGIDTNNIFIGGRSAGGDLSLATSFYSQRDVDSVLKTVIPDDCHKILGGLDSSTNNLTNTFRIRGVANMWGPIFDTAMISRQEALSTPIIMFHGTNDQSVPYKRWDTTHFPFIVYGSYYITQRYKHLDACYQLHTKREGGHGEDFDNEFLANHISAFFKTVMCNNCKSEEFESDVSIKSKIQSFFSADLLYNITPVILLILIVIVTIRFIKKRRRKYS